ncbi:Adenosine 5'-monophosphoramidase [Tilletia horrida]|uniref:Adenosine 5'-monophosphoramidase n=1 Tax=Tilletia horrida TaxID=155126 RepID=A0AAN6GMY8_9BASI|nr:Adenosine 5'-monophosphoramidase [Tilletia horrida]KAK0552743.1 Adenosine 5'-monophosphoramidase [Tilletia horrida]KAK0561923.1 Adenosine 5'-monophosphoramidase [Tilletia horrida]
MSVSTKKDDNCIFCKIIDGKIPSYKLAETESAYAFLDIGPLSKGHSLIIPKYHAAKLHELPDDAVADLLVLAKKVAIATGATDYNILQNNGRIAHQVVDHVHFHVIPKPNESEGLGIIWNTTSPEKEELQKLFEDMKQKL